MNKTINFKNGQTYRISKRPGETVKIHILEIVEERYIVYRWYGKYKQWWHYEIEKDIFLEQYIEFGKKLENKIK